MPFCTELQLHPFLGCVCLLKVAQSIFFSQEPPPNFRPTQMTAENVFDFQFCRNDWK